MPVTEKDEHKPRIYNKVRDKSNKTYRIEQKNKDKIAPSA